MCVFFSVETLAKEISQRNEKDGVKNFSKIQNTLGVFVLWGDIYPESGFQLFRRKKSGRKSVRSSGFQYLPRFSSGKAESAFRIYITRYITVACTVLMYEHTYTVMSPKASKS